MIGFCIISDEQSKLMCLPTGNVAHNGPRTRMKLSMLLRDIPPNGSLPIGERSQAHDHWTKRSFFCQCHYFITLFTSTVTIMIGHHSLLIPFALHKITIDNSPVKFSWCSRIILRSLGTAILLQYLFQHSWCVQDTEANTSSLLFCVPPEQSANADRKLTEFLQHLFHESPPNWIW